MWHSMQEVEFPNHQFLGVLVLESGLISFNLDKSVLKRNVDAQRFGILV